MGWREWTLQWETYLTFHLSTLVVVFVDGGGFGIQVEHGCNFTSDHVGLQPILVQNDTVAIKELYQEESARKLNVHDKGLSDNTRLCFEAGGSVQRQIVDGHIQRALICECECVEVE